MNDIANWMQNNWYEFGSLLAQFAFLIAAVWLGRKILKSMRATQQQFGALLRLSMTEGLEERSKVAETSHESMAPARPSVVASPMFSPVAERPAAPTNGSTSYAAFEKPHPPEAPSLSDELSGRPMASAPMTSLDESTPYVAAPWTLPEDENSSGGIAAAGRGVVQWLNTPMASSSGTSPWRKIVRWLQAPARS